MSKIGIFYVEMLSDLNSKFLRSSVVLELKLNDRGGSHRCPGLWARRARGCQDKAWVAFGVPLTKACVSQGG